MYINLHSSLPLQKRRFDIRYFVLIAQGKVYLHSYMFFRWSLGPEYDPKNTNVESQVINVVAYSAGADLMARLHFVDEPLKDTHGNVWNNSAKKRRRIPTPGSSSKNYKGFDPHSWRDSVSDALEDACGVFANAKELTKADPTKYLLAGGDAMIKEDGSAVIVEFNVSWSSSLLCIFVHVIQELTLVVPRIDLARSSSFI